MKVLLSAGLLFVMIGSQSPVGADESSSKPKTSTKDPKAVITQAGTVSGTITKLDDEKISLKVSETTTTPGPNKTSQVNGRTVSVPTTKTKTVQKDVSYPLESDARLKLLTPEGRKAGDPKLISDLKTGDQVVVHLQKHTKTVDGKPEVKLFVSQADYSAVTAAKKKSQP